MKVLVPLPIDLSVMANGRTLRVVHLLRELNHGCELTCVVPNDQRLKAARQALPNVHIESPDAASEADRKRWPADLLPLDGLSRRGLSFVGLDEPTLRMTAELASRFDTVFGFDVISLGYLLAVRHTRGGRQPRIVADMIDDPWITCRSMSLGTRLSPAGLKQAAVVYWLRSRLIGGLDACTAVAQRDAESLATATGLNVPVVPNGVYLCDASCLESRRENLVVLTGAMQFPPNAAAACWLVRRVWPRVWRAMGGGQHHGAETPEPVQLAIIGTSPTLRARRLAETPGVVVTGAVDDVGAWLKRARLAVAPMVTGSGIKNKVLEASAAACPVVATSLGVAGLPSGDNNGSLVADRAEELADKIVTLLQNPSLARTIGLAGRAMVSRQYSWPRMAQRMLGILEGPRSAGNARTCPEGSSNPPTHALSGHQSESSREKESLAHATS